MENASVGGKRLFSSQIRRPGPALYTESHFDFLNRVEGRAWDRVRDLAEAWYADFPDVNGDLRERFRQPDVNQHVPAWWELYIYTLLRRMGYAVTVHPTIPAARRHPDFLAVKDGSQAYVECVALFEDGSARSTDSEAWLKDCIDAVRNPDFMVSVRFEHHGSRRPKQRIVTQPIEQWLSSLDYESARNSVDKHQSGLPARCFDFADWRVELTALPVSSDARGYDKGRIGIGPSSGAFPVQSVDEIRDILKSKAKQCRGVDAPLIIAMLNWSTFASPREVEEALFGSECIRYNSNSPKRFRASNGYWNPGPPAKGSGISALIFGEHISAYRVSDELPTLWSNPWARQPLTGSLLLETHTAHDTGEVFETAPALITASEVFGLGPEWPGFSTSRASGPNR